MFADHEPGELRAALSAHGGSASQWLTDFDDFLAVYGHRSDATCDVGLPSWIEDNSNAFGNIKTFLLKDDDHDFDAAARNALEERDEAIEIARSGLTKEEQAVFDGGLAANQAANFPWWQDDHNFYIDLKVMLPLRRACQELARRVDADHKDDMLYLFWPEVLDVAAGKPYPGELKSLVADRRQYFDHWHAKRSEMPKVLGAVPGVGRGPRAHRDLRHQPRLAARGAEPGRGQPDHADRGRRGEGRRHRHRAGAAERRRPAPARAGRDPRVRVDVAELDPGVRQDRRRRCATVVAC